MQMLMISPKVQFYSGKGVNSQRTYRSYYKKYLDLLAEHNIQIVCLLEDALTVGILNELEYSNVSYVTCISKQDMEFFMKYPEYYELPTYFSEMYEKASERLYGFDKKYQVPPTLMREGKEVYFKARTDSAKKRISKARDMLIEQTKNIIQFRADSNMDNIRPLRESVELGDGKLCIEVALSSGTCVSYYGGSYIPDDIIPSILDLY